MIPDSLDKIETWAREYHAETEQGFGTTADNMSPLQHFLVERIYANSKGLLYDVASCLISGKGFRMPNNLISLHFFNNRLTVDELILEGQIEVFYCLPRFDPNEEKFRTFLKYNAAGAMQKYANKTYFLYSKSIKPCVIQLVSNFFIILPYYFTNVSSKSCTWESKYQQEHLLVAQFGQTDNLS